jgi:hypothetical protein
MFQQLDFHTQQTIKTTSTQDLHPVNHQPLVPWIGTHWDFSDILDVVPTQWCVCNSFYHDSFGDHLQTCRSNSVVSQTHDWVVHLLGGILGSVGHRVKIHKITPATGKERGDLEIQDYVVLQKPQAQADRLPPPRTLILDFTFTHTRYGSSHVHTTGQLTNTMFLTDWSWYYRSIIRWF